MPHAVLRPCVRGIFHKVISGVISHSDEASSGRKSYPCPSRYSFPEQPQQGDLHSRQRNYPATGMSCPRRGKVTCIRHPVTVNRLVMNQQAERFLRISLVFHPVDSIIGNQIRDISVFLDGIIILCNKGRIIVIPPVRVLSASN